MATDTSDRQLALLRDYDRFGFSEKDERARMRRIGMNPDVPGALSTVRNQLFVKDYITCVRPYEITARGRTILDASIGRQA